MAKDRWTEEKKGLRDKNPKTFIYAVNHLLLQRDPTLVPVVRGYEAQIFGLALAKTTKPPQVRLDAIKALRTLDSDLERLRPLLETEKSTDLLRAVAEAVSGGALVKSAKAVGVLLAKIAKPGDWSPQYDAVSTVRYFDDPRVVPALIAALAHPQTAVRREAIVGLGHQRATAVVPELIKILANSTEPQHLGAAARALTTIGTPKALEALENPKHYAHALKRAKNQIDGRFAIHALKWFRIDHVNDDLIAFITNSDDGEVQGGAADGLVHRQAAGALAAFAKHALKNEDTRWLGSMLIDTMIRIFATVEVDPAVATELAKELGAAKAAVLEEILDDSEQQRYRIGSRAHEEQLRINGWRDAIAGAVKGPGTRPLVARFLTEPE